MKFAGQICWDRFRLDFSGRTLVMGILNVTPDSFSDAGEYFSLELAIVRAMQMVDEGADIIDIGGESTRPGSQPTPVIEQIHRVVPVLEKIAGQINVPISIDTTSSQVARAAIDAGASIINDISALRFDSKMAHLAAEANVPVILMHMQGTPQTMQEAPYYEEVVSEVKTFLQERMDFAARAGLDRSKLIIDVGIGFGKRFEDNMTVLSRIEEYFDLDRPVMVGHSRKGFIGKLTGQPAGDRDQASLAIGAVLAGKGVHILRVHEVKYTRQACEIIWKLQQGNFDAER